MADDEVGVEPERLAELASALENLRDVLAHNVPIIVNTMEEYWNSGTGRLINLMALKQAQAHSVRDAADMRARSDLAQDWMRQSVNIDLVSSGLATIPWDREDIGKADARLQAQQLAVAESSGDLAQVKAIQTDIQDHLDDQDTAWLKVFYDQAAPQVANLAALLSRQDHAGTVLLSPADRKILNIYASGLAMLSRTNSLTQPVIAKYTSARDLWSVAMLVKYGPGGSAYGTSTSFAPGSTSRIQQGFLAQLTDAVYAATGNGTITMPLNWDTTESTVSGARAMQRVISEYDPLTAMLAADAQNKTAAGQVLAGPDGDAIAKTLEQTPFLTYLQEEGGGQPRLTSTGWSERTGPDIRTQLYDQQLVADFLTAATENPGNVNGSPPRGDSALAWQAAQAAIRIVTNAPDPSAVVVSEPVRQAMLTTFGRYLLSGKEFFANHDGETPSLWERSEPIRKILEGFLAPFDMAGADSQLETLAEIAKVLQKWTGPGGSGFKLAEQMMLEGKNASDEIIEGAYALQRMASSPRRWGLVMNSLPEIKGAVATLTTLGVIADIATLITPQDSGAWGDADRGTAFVNGVLLTLNATTDEVPVWGEGVITVTGAYLAADYADNHSPLFRDVTAEASGATLTNPADSIAVAENTMHAVHDIEHGADESGHAIREGWNSVTASITSSIGRWF